MVVLGKALLLHGSCVYHAFANGSAALAGLLLFQQAIWYRLYVALYVYAVE